MAYVAVNGQTGEACADLPIDLKKYAAGAAILSVLAFALLWFLPAPTPLITSIVSGVTVIISAIIYGAQSAALKKWETGESDRGLSFVGKTLGQAGNTPNSDPKTGAKSQTSKNLFSGALFPVVVSAIICGFLIFIRPVSDLWYYSGSIIMLFLVLSILIRLMKRYNMLTTRPLPQFSRTGGDDSAKQAIRD